MKVSAPVTRKFETERKYILHPSTRMITTDGTEDVNEKVMELVKKGHKPYDKVVIVEPSGRKFTVKMDYLKKDSFEKRWFPYVHVEVNSDDEIVRVGKMDLTCGYSTATLRFNSNKYRSRMDKKTGKMYDVEFLTPYGFPTKEFALEWMETDECYACRKHLLDKDKSPHID